MEQDENDIRDSSTGRFYPITSLIASLTSGPIKESSFGKAHQMNPVQRQSSHTAAQPWVQDYPSKSSQGGEFLERVYEYVGLAMGINFLGTKIKGSLRHGVVYCTTALAVQDLA